MHSSLPVSALWEVLPLHSLWARAWSLTPGQVLGVRHYWPVALCGEGQDKDWGCLNRWQESDSQSDARGLWHWVFLIPVLPCWPWELPSSLQIWLLLGGPGQQCLSPDLAFLWATSDAQCIPARPLPALPSQPTHTLWHIWRYNVHLTGSKSFSKFWTILNWI